MSCDPFSLSWLQSGLKCNSVLIGAHVLSMVWQSTEAMYVMATQDHINGETQMICDPFALSWLQSGLKCNSALIRCPCSLYGLAVHRGHVCNGHTGPHKWGNTNDL